MSSWTRRSFGGAGLTQVPAGPYLATLQRHHGGGSVILCIDVSGSMSGQPLQLAVKGAHAFVDEGVAAGYSIGLVLWNNVIAASTRGLSSSAREAHAVLNAASSSGGNDLLVVLEHCDRELAGLTGDRVVAIFGDGDISPEQAVLAKVAEMKADNIRFVTRGLGASAAQQFAKLASDENDEVQVSSVANLAQGIASMSAQLKRRS